MMQGIDLLNENTTALKAFITATELCGYNNVISAKIEIY